jgi:hypothetical protein
MNPFKSTTDSTLAEGKMTRRPFALGAAVSILALTALGCSLPGRLVDNATGGAASTLQSLQSEMESILATIPAELPGEFPGELPGALPGLPPEATDDGPPILDVGSAITGNLSYPSEGIPPLKVVAFDMMTQAPAASLETEAGQSTYSLVVPPGVYNIVAYTLDGQLAGGYTMAVMCGLTVECTDHTLIPVPAANGLAADGIDPADWYAPAGSFPPAP